ncbi:MAG: ribosome silencing factor [Flavobacteriales bacterium]|nr:MAG: ribosome silencing factor [Flavobacteriales bacterium]
MTGAKSKVSSAGLAKAVIHGIQEIKGEEITCLNLKNIDSAVCDYFIICHGNSHRHVSAIAESVEEEIRKKTGEKPWHREGKENAKWILLDYVDTVVHIFTKETREFYNLEDLWADAEEKEVASAY